MANMSKSTPAAYFQQKLNPKWGEVNGMQVAISFDTPEVEADRKRILGVTDVSCLQRFGVKGSQAAHWLVSQNRHIPDRPNSWLLDNGILVLRLGSTEFLIEDQSFSNTACYQFNQDLQINSGGVYPVLRADAAFVVSGREVPTMLAELCKLDFSEKALIPKQLMMTQLADISVTIVAEMINSELMIRLWCDGTYGAYLWRVLHQLAQELGGGAVGSTNCLLND